MYIMYCFVYYRKSAPWQLDFLSYRISSYKFYSNPYLAKTGRLPNIVETKWKHSLTWRFSTHYSMDCCRVLFGPWISGEDSVVFSCNVLICNHVPSLTPTTSSVYSVLFSVSTQYPPVIVVIGSIVQYRVPTLEIVLSQYYSRLLAIRGLAMK